jgi:hypothetical protein
VTRRLRPLLSAAVVLGLAPLVPAEEPARLSLDNSRLAPPATLVSANQQTANTIAQQLQHNPQLKHYQVSVEFQGGVAALSGSVADQSQRAEVVRLVQQVPSVERVVDRLTIVPVVQQTNNLEQGPPAAPPPVSPPPAAPPPLPGNGAPSAGAEPVPMVQFPPASPYDLNPPKMPPYAWPTYAPYNNYSRVGYPNLYPYNSWPYIGPIYPFPKIPLSWRKVTLEWQDGHWWYGAKANGHDWWRLRYW